MDHAPIKYEKELWNLSYRAVAGIDEAGRGPLAGPVVAACVILPTDVSIDGIYDSKKLSPKRREAVFEQIQKFALGIGIGYVDNETIDEINILNATKWAMKTAIETCSIEPDYLLLDAVELSNVNIPQRSIIKGDSLSQSIAAASIIAKVTRDREMEKMHRLYPEYGFDRHKGYGTKQHIEAIKVHGLSPIHRISFSQKFVQRKKKYEQLSYI